jgi:hypothetical protein
MLGHQDKGFYFMPGLPPLTGLKFDLAAHPPKHIGTFNVHDYVSNTHKRSSDTSLQQVRT